MRRMCKMVEVRGSGVTIFFFQAEDGIRDAQESRGLGDVYKRQIWRYLGMSSSFDSSSARTCSNGGGGPSKIEVLPMLSLIHI